MAIALELFNFVVPIKLIHQKYPGGWKQCLLDHEHLLDGRVWYDKHLFRDGSMDSMGIDRLIEHWEGLGFECIGIRDGAEYWRDVAACNTGGTGLECDWLGFDHDERTAYLLGEEKGEIVHSPFRVNEGAK